jgi:hypothetical protein
VDTTARRASSSSLFERERVPVPVNPPLYLLYLDRYHQGDPLFLKELAQQFARAAPAQVPALLLHTGGEKLERTLEAEGIFPERREGVVQTETPRQVALAERATREANQEIVALFTDEEVSAVGLQGADRGLLRRTETGAVEAGAFGWVADLVKMRVVPVLSALASVRVSQTPERVEAVPPARAAVAVAGALGDFDVTICFFTKGKRPQNSASGTEGAPDALAEVHAEPDVVRWAAEQSGRVLLTDLRGLFEGEEPQGKWWKNNEEPSAEGKVEG